MTSLNYDIEEIDPNNKTTVTDDDDKSPNFAMRWAVVGLLTVGLLCSCGAYFASGSTATPTPDPIAALATTQGDAAAAQAADKAKPTTFALPKPVEATNTPAPTPTETAIPCAPEDCPSIIGFITFEYLVYGGMKPITDAVTTHEPCKFSNIMLNSSNQLSYLIVDNYRFPGDPTSRLGQFFMKRTDKKCKYPVFQLLDYYPFDQNIPAQKMVKVGETYQEVNDDPFNLKINTPTPETLLGHGNAGQVNPNPMYYNTPLASPSPTPTTLANYFGYMTAISNCNESTFGIATSGGEMVVAFSPMAELPPLGYRDEATLIGQQDSICGRNGIRVSKAIYRQANTPTPAMPVQPTQPRSTREPTATATPSPTPPSVRLTGQVVLNQNGCFNTDVAFYNRGNYYYLIFENGEEVEAGQATVMGKLLAVDDPQRCESGDTILVSRLIPVPTPTPTLTTTPMPTATPVELFDEVGPHPEDTATPTPEDTATPMPEDTATPMSTNQ
jgi:hypothetical protein